jgi:hypothetical protein
LYGAWQVQRLFFHQYGENMVTLDRSKPIARFDGLTALELDQQGYAYYPTTYPITMTDGVGYTSAQYGLASLSTQRRLTAKGDLFAGLDASLLGPTAEPYVAPSPTPQASEPAADTAAIAAATPVTTAQTAQAGTAPSNTTDIPNTALLIGCAATGVLALIGAVLLKKGTRLKIVAIIVAAYFCWAQSSLPLVIFNINRMMLPPPSRRMRLQNLRQRRCLPIRRSRLPSRNHADARSLGSIFPQCVRSGRSGRHRS